MRDPGDDEAEKICGTWGPVSISHARIDSFFLLAFRWLLSEDFIACLLLLFGSSPVPTACASCRRSAVEETNAFTSPHPPHQAIGARSGSSLTPPAVPGAISSRACHGGRGAAFAHSQLPLSVPELSIFASFVRCCFPLPVTLLSPDRRPSSQRAEAGRQLRRRCGLATAAGLGRRGSWRCEPVGSAN